MKPEGPCSSYSHAEMVEVIGLKDQAWPCRRCGYRQDQHASWKTNPVITVLERPPIWKPPYTPARWPLWTSIPAGIALAFVVLILLHFLRAVT